MDLEPSIQKGSVRELWKVSFPMMINFMSMFIMLFVDRIFLAHYSVSALNASVQAGTLAWGFILGWNVLGSIAQIFVAQHNGAKEYKQIGTPIWQMIWVSVFSCVFFIPLAIWGPTLFYGAAEQTAQEREYFRYLVAAGPIFSLVPTIGGFFVGRGKTQIMQWLAIIGNCTNVLLDPLLIFGLPGLIPEMGVIGAALATNIGNVLQVVILGYIFLKKSNRERYKTGVMRLEPALLRQCIRIGTPPAISLTLEVLAWALFYHMIAQSGPLNIWVASVSQSILLLFFFFGMGLEKGIVSLTGNLIGAGKPQQIYVVLKSSTKLIFYYFLFTTLLLVVFPKPLIEWFFRNSQALEKISDPLLLQNISIAEVKSLVRGALLFICCEILFANLRWSIQGILTATGDTFFLLISGAASIWFFLIIPTYFAIYVLDAHIYWIFATAALYAIISYFIVLVRFMVGSWKQKDIRQSEHTNIADSNPIDP